tara:strand:+ start:2080 stop:2259 length:180 start_codon:yes stop_codon:yes gene_type:complete
MNVYAIVDRLKEPSTWAGLAAALGGLGAYGMSSDDWTAWFALPAAVAMFLSIMLKEGKR